ncbi:TPA: phenylacetate--CoA ligase family protein, partial [Vibrio diabolicus]
VRHSGIYREKFEYYKNLDGLTLDEAKEIQRKKLNDFLTFATKNSSWYEKFSDYNSLSQFPILTKEELINNLDKIKTIPDEKGIVSYTGGTTGASLKVIYTESDMQERFAILDSFRAIYGYKLGSKVAWFSGKEIVSKNKSVKFHRDDYINKIRFFSTFHINKENFDFYWKALKDFSPEFIVGFPSSLYEICLIAKSRNLKLDTKVKVFFPTAETVLPVHRELIKEILGCVLIDQYASSEGAPFILECKEGKKHLQLLSGVFEVVDEKNQPAKSGELIVTSFNTHGTPLIRYKIGDRVTLGDSSETCKCGSPFPIVESIEGRNTDYIESPQYGKVNLGNISNATKGIEGIIQFQIIQYKINSVEVRLVVSECFDKLNKTKFIEALKVRFGDEMFIDIIIVDNIEKENSGKFRIVKRMLEV